MKTIYCFLILLSFSAESQEFFCDSVEVFVEQDSITWKSYKKIGKEISITVEMEKNKILFQERKFTETTSLVHEFRVESVNVSDECILFWLSEGENSMLLTIPSDLKKIRIFYRNTECAAIKKEFRIKKLYTTK